MVVALVAIMSAIDNIGWVFLVTAFFACRWLWIKVHDIVVDKLRLNIGPSFEQNLGSWFSITSLAFCTIGLLQRTFGIRMTVGVTLIAIGEIVAGFLHFGKSIQTC